MKTRRRTAALILAALAAATLTTGCASMTEPWNDAPVKVKDDSPAEIYSMPDGFANVAAKCDRHGNRISSTRGADTGGGKAVAVIPQDPDCKAARR
jgi:hypothetical protein